MLGANNVGTGRSVALNAALLLRDRNRGCRCSTAREHPGQHGEFRLLSGASAPRPRCFSLVTAHGARMSARVRSRRRWRAVERTRGARAKVLAEERAHAPRPGPLSLDLLDGRARRVQEEDRQSPLDSGLVRVVLQGRSSRRTIKEKRRAPIMTGRSRLAQAQFIVTIVSPLKEALNFQLSRGPARLRLFKLLLRPVFSSSEGNSPPELGRFPLRSARRSFTPRRGGHLATAVRIESHAGALLASGGSGSIGGRRINYYAAAALQLPSISGVRNARFRASCTAFGDQHAIAKSGPRARGA